MLQRQRLREPQHRVAFGVVRRVPQRRKQVGLLVRMVVRRGLAEVAQNGLGRFHGAAVRAVARQVPAQAPQRLALRLHAAVASRQHFQRHFGGGGVPGLTGQGDAHDHGAS